MEKCLEFQRLTNQVRSFSGTTIVMMKDGKVFKEQDFFDNHTFLMQLGLI